MGRKPPIGVYMLELETTIEMMVDMSCLPLSRIAGRGGDITYKLIDNDIIYFIIFNVDYESINAHEVKCSSPVDVDSGISPTLIHCKSIITINSSDMCERFNTVVEYIKNAI